VVIIGVSAVGVFMHVVAMLFDTETRLTLMYTRNQFYAFAMFLCFVQLMDFLSFHHLFGPWAIIIREMMKDLLSYFFKEFNTYSTRHVTSKGTCRSNEMN